MEYPLKVFLQTDRFTRECIGTVEKRTGTKGYMSQYYRRYDMKRIILILTLALSLCLTACGEAESQPVSESPTEESTTEESTTETILIDDDSVKVSFVEIFEEATIKDTCYLKLLVENKTDQKVTVYLKDAYVNDTSVQMMSGVPMDIEAGKKSQNPFIFTGYTKDDVTSVEFKIWVVDENMNTLDETDTVTAYEKE